LAALIVCGAHKADAVMVNGQWRVKGGEMVSADVGAIMESHHNYARNLQARISR